MFSKYFVSSFGSRFHHLGVHAVATSYPTFPRIALFKQSLLSTSTAANDTPTYYPEAENTCPVSDFLLKECGLCLSEVSTILKSRPSFVRTRSTHILQQAVQVMRDLGFTELQVRNIITKNPTILTLNAERQWKPKIELMKTLGLTAQESGKVLRRRPRLIGCSLEKTLSPNIQYLQNLFGSEADISRVFKCATEILTLSNGPEILEKRLKLLASFGLPEDEIKEIVRRSPLILSVSMDKVQKITDFFIHTAGLSANLLLKRPLVLNYSLEHRIKPRYKVLKSVSVMQPSRRLPNLITAVFMREIQFLEIYVKGSPHATKLLEIYKGKPPVDIES